MRRNSYVDDNGNAIDQKFESKKPILFIFFIIGTIIPLILIGLIIYTMFQNNSCNNVYKEIKTATKQYLKEEKSLPDVEGENITISLNKLYSGHYLNSFKTKNTVCKGKVKTTKYKSGYVYTLDLTNCNMCTTSKRYGGWSKEISYLPKNKPIVDIIPYYNYYERQVVTTDWSKYYGKEELDLKKSKYGVYLPNEENLKSMPDIPEEGQIFEVQKEEKNFYRYKDKQWKWYNIPGDYSNLSSEKPSGYATKDENTKTYTKWSKYSLTYPEEKLYREISTATGYQFYYVAENGKKIYANNKKYTTLDDVDQKKYNKRENKTVDMYRYRDAQWRWYNGEKRQYSSYSSEKPSRFNYRDDELVKETNYASWEPESKINPNNKEYRTEETKLMTRFRYLYEILSAPLLKKSVTREEFINKIGVPIPEFILNEDYKTKISYKFKYRKK